jgi:sugar lactone lactonase YvrE
VQAELVTDVGARHGEGPLWHPVDRTLDWVDLGAGLLHRTDPVTGATGTIDVGSPLGAFAPRERGGFVLAVEQGFALLEDGEVRLVAPVDHAPGHATRMNDGKCDPRGCFWAGSMAYDVEPAHAALYRLDPALRATRVLDGVTISNGLEWSDDGRTLYYVDSLAGASYWDVAEVRAQPGVDVFDCDPVTGALSARRRLFDVVTDPPDGIAVPDGMTRDAEGCFWVAVHGAGEVRRYDPSGALRAVVELPTPYPTSVAFGGDDLDVLYVTSMHAEPRAVRRSELDGALFRVRPGVRGRPPRLFAG